jgi:flagellar biosynthetic protein FlhB
MSQAASGQISTAPLATWSATLLLIVSAPTLAMAWIAAGIGSVAQGGIVFAPAALAPQSSRLSPAARLRQLFSLPAVSRLIRAVLPASMVAYLATASLIRDWQLVINAPRLTTIAIAGLVLGRAFELAWKAGLVLLAWAVVDLFLERQHLAGELRMTRQELKEDYKETEGNPLIKGRIRRLRRQTLRRRMLEDTKRASVVITNPNEFAIALEYKPAMAAPMVIAKGRNLLAQQIKQVARWHGIPMIENPPLAHALYRATEIGQYIPPKLYRAVAAILAAIQRAEQRARGPQVNRG